jgi:hypothetical protein
MRNIRDTFIHFLGDNLAGLTVHNIRNVKDDPSKSLNQIGAVNVHFLNSNYDIIESEQHVTIAILHENELTAQDMEEQVVRLLQQGAYTPLLDYSTNPNGSPVGNFTLRWSTRVNFRPISAEHYYHTECTLLLTTHFS